MKRTPLTRKTPLKRSAINRGKGPSLRRTPLRKVNTAKVARRAKQYRQVLASDFHKKLRYDAFLRSGGFCECAWCANWRVALSGSTKLIVGPHLYVQIELAATTIPVWFTKRGKEPWQRFRSKDGEIHHVRYSRFGTDNPAELNDVLWVRKECHQRIEAEHGTRRRYLSGAKQ